METVCTRPRSAVLVLGLGLLTTTFCSARPAASAVIQGKVLGANGKPLALAHVHVLSPDQPGQGTTIAVGKNGGFRVSTDILGPLNLKLTGTDHRMYDLPILVLDADDTIDLEAQLEGNTIPSTIDSVKIIGDFNRFSIPAAQLMVREKNGRFRAEFASDSSAFAYQVLVYGADPVRTPIPSWNGTQADRYVYDGQGDYRSVVKPKGGRATVVYDPKKAIRESSDAKVRFADPSRDRQAEVIQRNGEIYRRWSEAYRGSQGKPNQAELLYSITSEILDETKAALAKEADPMAKSLLCFRYSRFATLAGEGRYDSTVVRSIFDIVPATSRAWLVDPGMVVNAASAAGWSDETRAYLAEVIEKHPEPKVRRMSLLGRIYWETELGDTLSARTDYDRMLSEFGDSEEAKTARTNLSPDRRILTGRRIPDFSFASLDNPKTSLSRASLKGKVYLLDFWATWCGPCKQEIPGLETLSQKLKGRPFEIVSVSLDRKVEDVAAYRKEKSPMAWQHAFVDPKDAGALNARFEITGIPRPILVDAEGYIVATGTKLRGPNLEKTVLEALARVR